MDKTAIKTYITAIEQAIKAGNATEHTHRPALKELIESLEKIKEIKANYYVLSHGGVKEEIEEDIENNIKAVNDLNNFILEFLSSPQNKNDIHKAMSKQYDISENIPNYYLNDSLLSSHLAYLIDKGEIDFNTKEGEVLYTKNSL